MFCVTPCTHKSSKATSKTKGSKKLRLPRAKNNSLVQTDDASKINLPQKRMPHQSLCPSTNFFLKNWKVKLCKVKSLLSYQGCMKQAGIWKRSQTKLWQLSFTCVNAWVDRGTKKCLNVCLQNQRALFPSALKPDLLNLWIKLTSETLTPHSAKFC